MLKVSSMTSDGHTRTLTGKRNRCMSISSGQIILMIYSVTCLKHSCRAEMGLGNKVQEPALGTLPAFGRGHRKSINMASAFWVL